MLSFTVIALCAALTAAQYNPPPAPVELTSTKSGGLPVLPPGFTGVPTLEGAITEPAPVNHSYVPLEGPATAQKDLPAATYTATLPSVAFDELTGTVISGTLVGSSEQGADGVTFTLTLSNLPSLSDYGPFLYHIHNMPVPADGNCTATKGHFDITNAGDYYMCDTTQPQNCQIGDLAGKHGKISTAPTFSASYKEPYLSTDPSSEYFFGGKSVVIHTKNTTRLTCANFVQGSGSGGSGNNSSSGNTTSPTPASPPVTTGGASKAVVGGTLVALGAIVAFFI